jgi:hypothetical protein
MAGSKSTLWKSRRAVNSLKRLSIRSSLDGRDGFGLPCSLRSQFRPSLTLDCVGKNQHQFRVLIYLTHKIDLVRSFNMIALIDAHCIDLEERKGSKDAGRFGKGHWLGSLYPDLYNKPSYHKALDMWGEAA